MLKWMFSFWVLLFASVGFGSQYKATSLQEAENYYKAQLNYENKKDLPLIDDYATPEEYSLVLQKPVFKTYCKDESNTNIQEAMCKVHLRQLINSIMQCELTGIIKAVDDPCKQGKETGNCSSSTSPLFDKLCEIGKRKAPKNAKWKKKKKALKDPLGDFINQKVFHDTPPIPVKKKDIPYLLGTPASN